MKSLIKWLTRVLSENGEPSSKRVITVTGLLIIAPSLLASCLLKAPEQFGMAFEVWATICGGVYVGGTWAAGGKKAASTPTPTTEGV